MSRQRGGARESGAREPMDANRWRRVRLYCSVLCGFAQALYCAAAQSAEKGAVREPALTAAEQKVRNVLDCMQIGVRLFREHDFRRAAIEFEKVLHLDPSNRSAARHLEKCRESLSPTVRVGSHG